MILKLFLRDTGAKYPCKWGSAFKIYRERRKYHAETKNHEKSLAVAIGCALLLFMNTGICTTAGYSFFVPIATSLGVDVGLVSYSVTVNSIVVMIFCLFYGKLIKLPLKVTMIISGILMGGSWILQGIADNVMTMYVAYAIRGAASMFAGNMITSVILLNWFKHNTVMAAINTMDNLAPAIFSAPIAVAIETHGWRPVSYVIGVISIILTAVAAFLIVKISPQQCGLYPVGAVIGAKEETPNPTSLPGLTTKEALKTPKLYLAMFIAACVLFLAQGMASHRVPIIMGMGLTYVQANVAVGAASIAAVGFEVIFGAAADKFGLKASLLFSGVVYVIAMLIGLLAPSGIVAWGVAYGICTASMAVGGMYPAMAAKELFGVKAMAAISGWLQAAMMIGGIIGSAIVATIYTTSGDYNIVMIVAIIPAVLAAVIGMIAHKKSNRFVIN